MNDHIKHYSDKLKYEIDSWDLFEALKAGERIIIVDARSNTAYENEHIPFAISLPHRTMNKESTAHLNRDALYVTYCDGIGCNASTKGALKMAELGFNVKELIGGLDWWRRDGYQTEGLKGEQGKEVVCGC